MKNGTPGRIRTYDHGYSFYEINNLKGVYVVTANVLLKRKVLILNYLLKVNA